MSDPRVALVAEGPTDFVIIKAGLRALLARPFILSPLQPEATRPQRGTGWCGVFKWCREVAARRVASLDADPTLPGFDLFVIHLDADVAGARYSHGGAAVESASAPSAGAIEPQSVTTCDPLDSGPPDAWISYPVRSPSILLDARKRLSIRGLRAEPRLRCAWHAGCL